MEQNTDQGQSPDLLTWAKILIYEGCPLKVPLKSCPLADLMELPIEERLASVEQMPSEDIRQIINHHQQCLEKRISG